MDVENKIMKNICLKKLLQFYCFHRNPVMVKCRNLLGVLLLGILDRYHSIGQTLPEDCKEYKRYLLFSAYQAVLLLCYFEK